MGNIPLVGVLLPIFCLLLMDISIHKTNSQPVDCLASDQKALVDFKNGLEDPQNLLSSWRDNHSRSCCQWRGISCDNTTGEVVAIDLQNPHPQTSFGSSLSGEIRPSLMKLKSLKHLDLSFNTLKGIPIPSFFGSLVNLQYLNLSNAGFGGMIPPNLGNLTHLQFLDLNLLGLQVDHDDVQWLAGLVSLKHLAMNGVDLSLVGTNNLISALNKLPSLTELQLSSCNLFGPIPSPLPSLNFTSLVFLDLSFNSFVSKIPDWLVNITSLQHIDISYSGLYGRIPLGLGDLPYLMSLNLGGNQNLTASCSQLLRRKWGKIQVLDLPSNKLHGKLPSSFGNLTSLTYLDLSNNVVEGGIPGSIGKLCNLNVLNLLGNNMTGMLPEFLEGTDNCPSRKPFPYLEYFVMSNNQLSGKIPDWLGQLESLVELRFAYNLLEGSIPVSLGSLQNLTSLGLAGNELTGTLPESLGQLSQLSLFDVSSNKLNGMITESHFSKLGKLKILHLSSNSFIVNVSSNWIPPFQVRNLDMGSCALGPSFPPWLKSQKEVKFLDFSNASISGSIPNWFWDMSFNLSLLNISHNELQGQLPNPIPIAPYADVDLSFNLFEGQIPLTTFGIELLDLSHNHFKGAIPWNISGYMPDLVFLSLSHNQLSGELPFSLGEMLSIQVMDLSSNNFTGRIPPSLVNCSFLNVLDLGNNNLFGTIPHSLGQLQQLRSLHLSDNHFWGKLPSSFTNLSNLETMDLGNNGFSGTIPTWLGGDNDFFPHLRILNLRSNSFHGELPREISKLGSLQVLDLARNDLSGSIPTSLGDLKAIIMAQEQKNTYLLYGRYRGQYYEESFILNTKGQSLQYTKTLSLVTSIDLSSNNLSGSIPQEITKLSGLVVLNLSRNHHISGQIPEGMSNMHQLSSLDLSSNSLSGTIPSSLASLSFLGYLNLSNNNLSGAIPYTGQMTTFDASSFGGNLGLCGPPLHVRCLGANDYDGKGQESNEEDNDDDGLIDRWFFLSLGFGFAAGILVPYSILALKRSWSDAYFDFVDYVIDKLFRLTKEKGRNHNEQRKKPHQRG